MPATVQVADYAHGRVPRAVREQQLVSLAEQLFAERGFAGASMDELSRRAGVTKPVVYGLFGSKDGLYRACLERSVERLAEAIVSAVEAEQHPGEKLRAGGLAWLRFASEHRVAWDVLSAGDGRFAADVEGIRRRQAQLVADLLAADAGRGDPQELEAVAHMINGAFESVAHWAFDHPEVPLERLADWLVAMLAPGLERFT